MIKRKYPKREPTLSQRANNDKCLTDIEIKSLYPGLSMLNLWLRGNKEGETISQRKIKITAQLTKLECNNNYSFGLFTFINKYTGGTFQLDYKYYGKLWWVFRE
jgi:hypothetical protein